ncbi:MAG: hypothetical protein M9894_23320 [Planctomycetes bacterium]|nr:hypothetical protein [Planctomycetota bacterium]
MRRLIVVVGLGLVLALAVAVLYGLGRAGLASEARRLEDDARRARTTTLEAARDALAADLEALLRREAERPWYHWRALYLPPDLVATTLALVPSPLAERPQDPLVAVYFELRGGALGGPAAAGGAPDAAAAARRALAALGPLVPRWRRRARAPARPSSSSWTPSCARPTRRPRPRWRSWASPRTCRARPC